MHFGTAKAPPVFVGRSLCANTADSSDPYAWDELVSSDRVALATSIVQLRIPCLSAFLQETALPAVVLGPVERWALARFACSVRSEIGPSMKFASEFRNRNHCCR